MRHSTPSRGFADFGCCGCCLAPLLVPLFVLVYPPIWIDQTFFGGRGASVPYLATGELLLFLAAFVGIAVARQRNVDRKKREARERESGADR